MLNFARHICHICLLSSRAHDIDPTHMCLIHISDQIFHKIKAIFVTEPPPCYNRTTSVL